MTQLKLLSQRLFHWSAWQNKHIMGPFVITKGDEPTYKLLGAVGAVAQSNFSSTSNTSHKNFYSASKIHMKIFRHFQNPITYLTLSLLKRSWSAADVDRHFQGLAHLVVDPKNWAHSAK